MNLMPSFARGNAHSLDRPSIDDYPFYTTTPLIDCFSLDNVAFLSCVIMTMMPTPHTVIREQVMDAYPPCMIILYLFGR
jgi:hypothetical protein